jgi:alpha-L-rhamnosidase
MLNVIGSFTKFILLAFISVWWGLVSSFGQTVGGPGSPSNLRCEYLSDPLGIDTPQPRFFWVLDDARRGESQSAYQILVAATLQALAQGQGDQWDSGKVESDDSIQIVYAGWPLASSRRYYWKVRYWDKEGRASTYSEPAWFEMGLLSRDEWTGQ